MGNACIVIGYRYCIVDLVTFDSKKYDRRGSQNLFHDPEQFEMNIIDHYTDIHLISFENITYKLFFHQNIYFYVLNLPVFRVKLESFS